MSSGLVSHTSPEKTIALTGPRPLRPSFASYHQQPTASIASSPSLTMDAGGDALAASLCQHLFTSTLPLAISLNLADLPAGSDAALAKDLVCYVSARRSSYLPLIIAQVKEQLIELVVPEGSGVREDDLWFEYKGIPLKWHWPIGLLHDHTLNNLAPTHYHGQGVGASTFRQYHRSGLSNIEPWTLPQVVGSSSSALPSPWPITLRLRNLPHAKLPFPSSNPTAASKPGVTAHLIESAKQAFMAMLKEADFVRNGNTKKVNNLRREEQDGIWEALRTGDWNTYSTLMSKLLPPSSAYPPEFASASAVAASSASPSSSIPNRTSSLYSVGTGALGELVNESQTSLAPSLIAPSSELPLVPGSPGLDEAAGSSSSSYGVVVGTSGSDGTSTATASSPQTLKGHPLPGLKAIPVKLVLQGGIVLQEAIPPLHSPPPSTSNAAVATPTPPSMTLGHVLHTLFPALFPASPEGTIVNDAAAAVSSDVGFMTALAVPIIQGIRVPLNSSMPWLSRVMSGADGWLTIILLLLPKGDHAS